MLKTSTFRFAYMSVMAACAVTAAASADTVLYSNGFEVNNDGWAGAGGSGGTRVASGGGTLGAPSASGSFHGEAAGTAFTRFGGYNYGAGGGVPTVFREFRTSIDIYLNMGVGASNDTRFDYTSAVSNAAGDHRRDFIFNGGFYNDGGNNRFVFSASNNSPGWPGNPSRDPVTISTTGWYTFEHHFYNDGGVLAVDLRILDAADMVVKSWTLKDMTDTINLIGGSRYGWFPVNGFGTLAIDNASLTVLTVIPLPPAAWAGLSTLAGVGFIGFIRRRRMQA